MPTPWLPDLPVRAVLGAVTDTLAEHGAAELVAPPGTGKTTLVPLALAAAFGGRGRVLVAEPRRLATRAAAARMAALLGEPVGETVGYAVHGEARRGPRTRIEVVTSGLLLRRLTTDPELVGVGCVVLDECHERRRRDARTGGHLDPFRGQFRQRVFRARCSPGLADRPPSPPISPRSGPPATRRCVRNCAAAIPSTAGPRTPRHAEPSRPGARGGPDHRSPRIRRRPAASVAVAEVGEADALHRQHGDDADHADAVEGTRPSDGRPTDRGA